MAGIPFLRRHARWRDNISAYVDDELPAAEHARFEAHMQSCEACRVAVADARQLKLLVANMPEAPLPRAFRLTPEMVAPAAARRPLQRSQAPVRIAQFAAGLATVALIAVLTIDLTASSGSSNTNTQADASLATTRSKAASAPEAASAAAATTTSTRDTFSTASDLAAPTESPTPTKGLASPSQPGVEGASNATPTPGPAYTGPEAPSTGGSTQAPAATSTAAPSESPSARAADNAQPSSSPTPATPAPEARSSNTTNTPLAPQAPDTGAQPANGDAEDEPPTLPLKGSEGGADHGWYRPAEYALVGFAVLAAIASILLTHRRRSDDE